MSKGVDNLKMGKILTFKLNLTLKVKVNSPTPTPHTHLPTPHRQTIGTLTKVFCIFGPNLVILAWTGPELSRGLTHRLTDTHTQIMTIPDGQN